MHTSMYTYILSGAYVLGAGVGVHGVRVPSAVIRDEASG